MTPTTDSTAAVGTKTVTTTVFDLDMFDDVKLTKQVAIPPVPQTLEEALAAVGNDTEKLLRVIHEGLTADAVDTAKTTLEGFSIVSEDGTPGAIYTGNYADEDKGKLINGGILALAKIYGYDKSLSVEKKRALKAQAVEFMRSNPAMLESLKNSGATTAE